MRYATGTSNTRTKTETNIINARTRQTVTSRRRAKLATAQLFVTPSQKIRSCVREDCEDVFMTRFDHVLVNGRNCCLLLRESSVRWLLLSEDVLQV